MKNIISFFVLIISFYSVFASQLDFSQHGIVGQRKDVLIMDFDLDGDEDMISAGGSCIFLHVNDGSENFKQETISCDGSLNIDEIFVVDLDSDNDLDVISGSTTDFELVWYENNNGVFEPHLINDQDQGTALYAIDYDGDNDIDILSSISGSGELAWFVNDGSENFVPTTLVISDVIQFSPSKMKVLDFDMDNDLDIVVGDFLGNTVYLLENNGDNSYLAHGVINHNFVAFGYCTDIDVGDLDNDGDLDIAATSEVYHTVMWCENVVDSFIMHTLSGSLLNPQCVEIDDVDGDGDLDVISGSLNTGDILWFRNLGNNNFLSQYISSLGLSILGIVSKDIDQDGDKDIAIASAGYNNKIFWYDNNGSQSFSKKIVADGSSGFTDVFSVDMDLDGDEDILVAGTSLYFAPIRWYENDGALNFEARNVHDTLQYVSAMTPLDMDMDNDMDVVAAMHDNFNSIVMWYENDGEGNFFIHAIDVNAINYDNLMGVDLDSDGDMDLLASYSNSEKILFYENDGSENFVLHELVNGINGIEDIKSVDLDVDGDGDLDLAVTSHFDDKISWLQNNGNQNFSLITINEMYDKPDFIEVWDIDVDGDMDIISSSAEENSIVIFENDGNENFTSYLLTENAFGVRSISIADMDLDGDQDVLSASAIDNKISCYENLGAVSTSSNTTYSNLREDIRLFPLPSNGDISIVSKSKVIQATLYSLSGEVIEVYTSKSISGLKTGAYVLEVETEHTKEVKKVVVK